MPFCYKSESHARCLTYGLSLFQNVLLYGTLYVTRDNKIWSIRDILYFALNNLCNLAESKLWKKLNFTNRALSTLQTT